MKSPPCQLCGREKEIAHARMLYGGVVCASCHARFRGRRQVAWLLDAVLAFTVIVLVMGVHISDVPWAMIEATPAVVMGGSLPATIIFWGLMIGKDAYRGRSPGKVLFGLRVIWTRYADNPVFSPPEAVARVFD